jgi:soluble P-type ATPase
MRETVLTIEGMTVRGAIAVADTIKPSAARAVARLRGLGLHPMLLTGDNEATARAVAAAVGIEDVIAGTLPADKAAVITGLQARGHQVAMVGDGINDAPALAAADLGLALGSGTDVAMSAADLILLRDDLGAVPDAIGLSRATFRTIRQNLGWAFGYNAAAIPLAALGYLNPILAAAAMTLSSVFVVSNSLRLQRYHTEGDPGAPLAVGAFGDRDSLPGVPFLLDLAEAPDGQGGDPGDDEDADDDEPGLVDVEGAHERPEPAVEAVFLADEAEDLDGADEEGDEYRQARDRHVVVDLADRLGERPVVGEVHEAAVDGVEQAHPGGEQDRQRQDRVERQPGHHG